MVVMHNVVAKIHPILLDKVDKNEQYLMNFRESLKTYKPKQSTMEIGIIKTKDGQRISELQESLGIQLKSKEDKEQRIKLQKQYDDELKLQHSILEKNQIYMRNLEIKNDKKLEQNTKEGIKSSNRNVSKMSKKRKAKFDKIMSDNTLNEKEKQSIMDQYEKEAYANGKQKRSKLDDFKDSKNFIEPKKALTSEQKANSSTLWGEGEKNFLEDVTMNLVPDEDAIKNIKGTTAMKWDAAKKRYMLKKVDREGRVIAERRNEAGKKITKKMKEKPKESIYKKWQ